MCDSQVLLGRLPGGVHECYAVGKVLHYTPNSTLSQATSASFLMYYKLIINLPAVLLLLFCGAWSDRVGRKLPVVLSSFGTVVAVVFFMVSRLTIEWTVFIGLVFAGAAVRGAFGKSTVMTMAMHRSPGYFCFSPLPAVVACVAVLIIIIIV